MNDLSNKSILIVDDDPGMLRALEKVLAREGCAVTRATWVRGAIEQLMARTEPFDMVITDLRMPVASGMTLLQTVRTAYPSVPVIVITAYGDPDMGEEWWLEHGAAAYLEKPIDTGRLIDSIRRILSSDPAMNA